MPVVIDQVENATPGSGCLLGSVSEERGFTAVFEDDGDTGYFYACASASGPILDAFHIYNVKDVTDRSEPSEYKIGWSPSGRQAVLLINGHPHAVIDFETCRGWCRTGFPPSNGQWSVAGHAWDDACLDYFR